jgi:hypothetical protein
MCGNSEPITLPRACSHDSSDSNCAMRMRHAGRSRLTTTRKCQGYQTRAALQPSHECEAYACLRTATCSSDQLWQCWLNGTNAWPPSASASHLCCSECWLNPCSLQHLPCTRTHNCKTDLREVTSHKRPSLLDSGNAAVKGCTVLTVAVGALVFPADVQPWWFDPYAAAPRLPQQHVTC